MIRANHVSPAEAENKARVRMGECMINQTNKDEQKAIKYMAGDVE